MGMSCLLHLFFYGPLPVRRAVIDAILDDHARDEKRPVMTNLSEGTPLLALQDL
jgi:hypothetical protein